MSTHWGAIIINNPTVNRGGNIATSDQKQRAGNRQIVYECIVDLANIAKPASREQIRLITGLKQTLVDDHVKNLKTDGLIRTVVAGVYAPMEEIRSMPVSVTHANPGRVKIEVGDDCIELSTREAMLLGASLGGLAMLYRN